MVRQFRLAAHNDPFGFGTLTADQFTLDLSMAAQPLGAGAASRRLGETARPRASIRRGGLEQKILPTPVHVRSASERWGNRPAQLVDS